MCQLKDIEWFLIVVSKGVKTVQWIRKENTYAKDQRRFIIRKKTKTNYVVIYSLLIRYFTKKLIFVVSQGGHICVL